MKQLNIVLVEPEIPQNTGNIARTCACTGCRLHLVEPFLFKLEDRYLNRAGLDYWSSLDLTIHKSLDDFLAFAAGKPMILASTKAGKNHTQVSYPDGCFILFGKETAGLPESLLRAHYENCVRIPMRKTLRSLNLSNSAAIVIYEALRQSGFDGLEEAGCLTKEENNR